MSSVDPPAGGPETGPSSGAPPSPHCYRHPDRETYVSCVRCGRYICPDCMLPAAVGFSVRDTVPALAILTLPPATVAAPALSVALALPGSDVAAERPESVRSGRTLEQLLG